MVGLDLCGEIGRWYGIRAVRSVLQVQKACILES
jgi:hypothetical protein